MLSKGFRACFIAVMCALCVVLCYSAIHQASVSEEIRLTRLSLEATEARLELQQVEYAQVQVDLPETREQLAEVQPQAEEASAREQELRARRKALREENAALTEQIAALTAQQDSFVQQGLDGQPAISVASLQTALQEIQAKVDAALELLTQAEESSVK